MINPNLVRDNITIGGSPTISSFDGTVAFETGGNRNVIRDLITNEPLSVQDAEGFKIIRHGAVLTKISENGIDLIRNGVVRTKLNENGLTGTRANGTRYGKFGQADSDGRDGVWVARPNVNLANEGV